MPGYIIRSSGDLDQWHKIGDPRICSRTPGNGRNRTRIAVQPWKGWMLTERGERVGDPAAWRQIVHWGIGPTSLALHQICQMNQRFERGQMD